MNRDNRLRSRSDFFLYQGRIEVKRARVYIDKHRHGAEVANGFGGRKEGERGRNHFVARLDAQRMHPQNESVGPGVQRDRVPDAEVLRNFLLKGFDIWSHNEATLFQNALKGRHQLLPNRFNLSGYI